jgi:hypothetical protein
VPGRVRLVRLRRRAAQILVTVPRGLSVHMTVTTMHDS